MAYQETIIESKVLSDQDSLWLADIKNVKACVILSGFHNTKWSAYFLPRNVPDLEIVQRGKKMFIEDAKRIFPDFDISNYNCQYKPTVKKEWIYNH